MSVFLGSLERKCKEDEEDKGGYISEDDSTNCHDDHSQSSQSQDEMTRTRTCFFRCSMNIVNGIQHLCGLWGLLVGKYAWCFSLGCVISIALLGSGLFWVNVVFVPYELWVPEHSDFAQVINWTKHNFPPKYREHKGIWQSENVLRASFIQEIWEYHQHVRNMTVSTDDGSTFQWEDVCFRFPSNFSYESNDLSYAFWKYKDIYEKDYVCFETSLLELWEYDDDVIENLSDREVIEAVNTINKSQLYGIPWDVSNFLGGIERDENGLIYKATTAMHIWVTRIDYKAIDRGEFLIDIGSGEKVDKPGMAWERYLADDVEGYSHPEIEIMMNACHSIGDVLFKGLLHNSVWIVIGWAILVVYVIITLGEPNKKDHKIIPALIGLLSIGMAVVASFGACSYMMIPYGTLNNVLPILLVALGVDDMYVIMTAWNHIRRQNSLERRAQLTLENAGMAITVTSVTDIVAFGVGASTSLPGLRWFCIYAAMGITMVYILQSTLFLASLVINDRWMQVKMEKMEKFDAKMEKIENFEAKMDKMEHFDCIKSDFMMESVEETFLGKHLRTFGAWLMHSPVKIAVIVFTLLLFLFSVLSVAFMRQDFDAIWLVPRSSGLYRWFNTVENTFPAQREKGYIYFQGVKFPDDLKQLNKLSTELSTLPYVMTVDAWFSNIDSVIERHPWLLDKSPDYQCNLLKTHLPINYLNDFYFGDGSDGLHPCSTFRIQFIYNPLESHESKQNAMRSVRDMVANASLSGTRGVWAGVFSQWERDGVIMTELIRSLCVVIAATGLIMLVLLASVRGSLIVTICVIFTLIDVASFVHYWGLTINSISSIAFVLSVGICVDYAAHIVHNFLSNKGTRAKRVTNALHHMGSAVVHGGFSTFLSFVLLAPSDSYIYNAYFKILSSVSIFGLFHSLVFLPIILSLIGPDSYSVCDNDQQNTETTTSSTSNSPNSLKTDLSMYAIEVPEFVLYFEPTKHRCETSETNRPGGCAPPPYVSPDKEFPPLYRKSSSLPSLTIILDKGDGSTDEGHSASNAASLSMVVKSQRNSLYCSRL